MCAVAIYATQNSKQMVFGATHSSVSMGLKWIYREQLATAFYILD